MSSTEHAREPFATVVALADMHHFARLPMWLSRAARPDDVSHLLTRRIPVFATGMQRLDACKIGGLRLDAASRTWSGTYTLTVMQSTTEQQIIRLRGTVFPRDSPNLSSFIPM